jgi:hypothetical protein
MRLIPRFILSLVILMLVISFQNFSSVGPSEWDSANTLKIMKEMSEFEKNNPDKSVLATPQGGNDFRSVSNDWMQRQGSILLNGYDKKLEAALNDKLNAWVQEITRKDPMNEESPANGGGSAAANGGASEPRKKTKQNLRFARVNSLKYDLGEASCFNLTADPGDTHLDYSQALSSNTRLGLEHRTSDNKTQMFLKYEW